MGATPIRQGQASEVPMLKLQALPCAYFAWLLAGYALLTTLMKRYYVRRFGWQ